MYHLRSSLILIYYHSAKSRLFFFFYSEMLSLSSKGLRPGLRLGLTSINPSTSLVLRSISLKPDFSKYKLKEQPPGFVVGTVNEAYTPPEANFYEGGHHWSYERVVAGALVPLTIAPFILGTEIPMIDTIFSVTVLAHSHMGLKSCIIDYIPKRVYGVWHKLASKLLTLGSCVGLYGIYVMETTLGGLFELLKALWSA